MKLTKNQETGDRREQEVCSGENVTKPFCNTWNFLKKILPHVFWVNIILHSDIPSKFLRKELYINTRITVMDKRIQSIL